MKCSTSFLSVSTSFMFVAFEKLHNQQSQPTCSPQDLHVSAFMPTAEKGPKTNTADMIYLMCDPNTNDENKTAATAMTTSSVRHRRAVRNYTSYCLTYDPYPCGRVAFIFHTLSVGAWLGIHENQECGVVGSRCSVVLGKKRSKA